jgi:hypothetical protein
MKRLLRALALIALGLPSLALADLRGVSTLPFQINQATLVNGQTICYVAASLNWQNCTPGGGGNVSTSGSPVAAQLAIFSGSTGITGYSGLTYNNSTGALSAPEMFSSTNLITSNTCSGSSAVVGCQAFGWVGTLSGSASAGQTAAIQFTVSNDTANNTSALGLVSALEVDHFFGAMAGSANGLYVTLYQIAKTNATNGEFTGVTVRAQGNYNEGGTSGTPSGHMYAMNPQVFLGCNSGSSGTQPCATYWDLVNVSEFDITVPTNTSTANKFGISIVQTTGDAVQGSRTDAAIDLSNASGTPGWNIGLSFGGYEGNWPIASGGTLIGCYPHANTGSCGTSAYGIDFSNVVLTSYFLRGPSSSFTVDGSGNVVANSLNSTPVGPTTASTGSFTTLAASSTVSGTGFSNYLASPPAFGGTAPNTITGTHIEGITTSNDSCTSGASSCTGYFTSNQNNASLALSNTQTGGRYWYLRATGGSAGIASSLELVDGSTGLIWGLVNSSDTLGLGGSITSAAMAGAGITITSAGAVAMPLLSTSSAATTGTVCWTTSTGNLTVDTTLACLSSTGTVKKNIKPLEAGLAEVMALKPISYELKDEYNPEHLGEMVGLIAEDVLKVDPRLVGFDANGNARGVRYMQATALLVEAIQEQQAEIERLRRVN